MPGATGRSDAQQRRPEAAARPLQDCLDATDAQVQWALSGYTLVFGMVLVPAGRLVDVLGRRRLFVLGLVVFGVGALLSGLAPTGPLLDGARLVMGAGAGLFNPQVSGFIQNEFQGARRARAFGALGSTVGVSVAAGPLLSGSLIALLGPDAGSRASFLVNVPIAVVAAWLAMRRLPADAPAPAGRRSRPDLDPVGVALLAVGLLVLMLPFLDRGLGPGRFWLLPAAAVLLAAWVGRELRHRARGGEPMVDLALFRHREFGLGALLIAVYFTGSTSIYVVLAMFLQDGLGFPAWEAALMGLPSALLSSVMSTVAGRVVLRLGRRLVLLGLAMALTSILLSMGVVWAHLQLGASPWWLLLTLALAGAGQGMVVSPNQTLSLACVPGSQAGTAGGVLQTGQRVGTAVGSAVIVGVFLAVRASAGPDAGFLLALAAIAACILAAIGVAVTDLALGRRAAQVEQRGLDSSHGHS